MEMSEFAIELAKTIQKAFDEVKDDIAKSEDKDKLLKTFKDDFVAKASKEYNSSDKLEDIKALVELVVDELSKGTELNLDDISTLLDHRIITSFSQACWLIKEAITFKNYI